MSAMDRLQTFEPDRDGMSANRWKPDIEATRVKIDEVRALHARRVAGEQVPYTRAEADALVAYCLSMLRRKKPGLT